MNIEQVEKETISAMKGLADVLKVKMEEIRAMDTAKLATDSIFNPTFANLTEESQRAAREVLSTMLIDSYRHNFKLTRDEILELGHRVRKAFVTLESEEPKPEMCCGSDICSGLSTDASLSSGGLGIQQGVGLAMNSDTANQLKRKGML